jgi:hypothetical protein
VRPLLGRRGGRPASESGDVKGLWRLVAAAELDVVWTLDLVCGHRVLRLARYRDDIDVVTGEVLRVPLPAPRKVRCRTCTTERKNR